MSKPEIIRYHSLSPRVDGIKLFRVKDLSISADKARDPVSELGNSGIVEYIEQIPSVGITISTNNIGSTDNAALLSDSLVNYTLTKSQVCLDPRTDGSASLKFYNQIKLSSANASGRSITENSILSAYADITVPVTEDGTNITRTAWIHRAALSGFSMSFDVSGNATHDYTLQGNNLQWYSGKWKNTNCLKLININIATVRSGAASQWDKLSQDSQTFYAQHSSLPVGSSVIAVAVNENIFFKSKGWNFKDPISVLANGTAMMVATAGTKFMMIAPASPEFSTPWALHGSKVYALYSHPSRGVWANEKVVSTAGSTGALARQNINAYLWNTQETGQTTHTVTGRALRLQSVKIDVSPGAENLIELGAKNPYGYVRNTPVPVNITITANDSDLDLWASLAGMSVGTAQIRLEDFNNYNQLYIDIFRDESKAYRTSTLEVKNMTVTGAKNNVSVGGNASQEFSFLADNFRFQGSGLSPNV